MQDTIQRLVNGFTVDVAASDLRAPFERQPAAREVRGTLVAWERTPEVRVRAERPTRRHPAAF
jgi:hypothetical protein